jgi:deoxyribonuclease IV
MVLGRKKAAPPVTSKKSGTDLAKYDILKEPFTEPPPRTRLKIGIHTSTSGGVETSVERAYRLGCNTLQIFSSSPRTWRPTELAPKQCETVQDLREKYDIGPMVIHTSYLVNLCSKTMAFLAQSIVAFRAEVDRALSLGAEYLVLHPGSFRGGSREEGLSCASNSIAKAIEAFDFAGKDFKILIENTAGAEYSLGGSLEQVAELVHRLKKVAPVGVCLDTCHLHVAGYDVTTHDGFEDTLLRIDRTIGLDNVLVWHCNDAKAERGSKLDRHQHIGQGKIGIDPFRWLLNDERTEHAAFIAETPIDEPFDDQKNVNALKSVVA